MIPYSWTQDFMDWKGEGNFPRDIRRDNLNPQLLTKIIDRIGLFQSAYKNWEKLNPFSVKDAILICCEDKHGRPSVIREKELGIVMHTVFPPRNFFENIKLNTEIRRGLKSLIAIGEITETNVEFTPDEHSYPILEKAYIKSNTSNNQES